MSSVKISYLKYYLENDLSVYVYFHLLIALSVYLTKFETRDFFKKIFTFETNLSVFSPGLFFVVEHV